MTQRSKTVFYQIQQLWRRGSWWQRLAVLTLTLLVAGKFIGLAHSPPGFYVDEAVSAATIISVRQTGTDLEGKRWPVFAKAAGGGYVTPFYLYGGVAWSAVFGDSEYAFRAYSVMATLLAVGLLAVVAYLWFGATGALAAAGIGLVIPWSWHQGQLAWDPAHIPFWVALTLVGWSWLERRRWHGFALAAWAVGLVGMAYTYPPSRFAAAGGAAVMGVLLWRRYTAKRPVLVGVVMGMAVAAVPIILFMSSSEARQRSDLLSTWGSGARSYAGVTSTGQAVQLTVTNFISLLTPDFLFFKGDANLRHNAGTGMLGSVGLIILIVSSLVCIQQAGRPTRQANLHDNRRALLLVLGVIIGFGLLGSALTWESQPHSLRAVTAWPALVLVMVWLMEYIRRYSAMIFRFTSVSLAVVTAVFLWRYYTTYNQSASLWYDAPIIPQLKSRAAQGTLPDYGMPYEPYGQQYYILRQLHR